MRNLILIFIGLILFSCSDNEPLTNRNSTKLSNDNLQKIASKYGGTIKVIKSSDTVFRVSSLNELTNLFDTFKKELSVPKYRSSVKDEKYNYLMIRKIKFVDSIFKMKTIKNKTTSKGVSLNSNEDPPYSHSVTFYFDNTFPCSNVYVTINYNSDPYGKITSAEVTSGSYGYALGNSYSQINVNTYLSPTGIFGFQVTGQMSTSIGVGSFSLSNSNTVSYTGFYQGTGFHGGGGAGAGGNAGGFVKQDSSDHAELKEY